MYVVKLSEVEIFRLYIPNIEGFDFAQPDSECNTKHKFKESGCTLIKSC